MSVNFDGKPVVFVPSPVRLTSVTVTNPLNLEEHGLVIADRRRQLTALANEIEPGLVGGENLGILDGIEVLVMSERSARIGVEKGLGTILDEPFTGVGPRSRLIARRERTEASHWHLDNIGVREDDSRGGHGIIVGIADSWLYPHKGIDSKRELARSSFDAKGNPIKAREVSTKHGTSITSLILGDVGVARAAEFAFASVLTDCSTDPCSGSPVVVAAGLDWLVKTVTKGRRVRVINASLNVKNTAAMASIVASAWRDQVLIVGASGNHGGNDVACPGVLNDVIAAGALKKDDSAWRLTTASTSKPELWAPGDGVVAANSLNGYTVISGTSAAAALVTGAAAYILADRPSMTVSELHATLLARSIVVDNANGPKKKVWLGAPSGNSAAASV